MICLTGNGEVLMFGGSRHGLLSDHQKTSMLKKATQDAGLSKLALVIHIRNLYFIMVTQLKLLIVLIFVAARHVIIYE